MLAELVLVTTPPREPQGLLERPRLGLAGGRLGNAPILLLQAPAGSAKTTILCQWRREALAQGRVVLWLRARTGDTPARLILTLTHAFRVAAFKPAFGDKVLEGLETASGDGLSPLTGWLAAIAETATETVLIVDEAEKLTGRARDALQYLLHNLPLNLRAYVATHSKARPVPATLPPSVKAPCCAPRKSASRLRKPSPSCATGRARRWVTKPPRGCTI